MIIHAQIQLIWKFSAEAFHREKYHISQNEGKGGGGGGMGLISQTVAGNQAFSCQYLKKMVSTYIK